MSKIDLIFRILVLNICTYLIPLLIFMFYGYDHNSLIDIRHKFFVASMFIIINLIINLNYLIYYFHSEIQKTISTEEEGCNNKIKHKIRRIYIYNLIIYNIINVFSILIVIVCLWSIAAASTNVL
jgi:hypothetical protein